MHNSQLTKAFFVLFSGADCGFDGRLETDDSVPGEKARIHANL
jgi:hypothetical protein